ncbi:MAG: M15 family metallopeptidase [Methylocystis sp.]
MTEWPHEDTASLNRFYGDPRGENGAVSPRWEMENLVAWTPAFPMFYSDGRHTPLKTLRVHKKCLPAFEGGFKAALEKLGHDYIVEHRLNISGGSFCYRQERGGSRLSVHSWGCAIDMDPGHNPFPHIWVPNHGFLDLQFVNIMREFGFYWRGDVVKRDIDPMHLQLCVH